MTTVDALHKQEEIVEKLQSRVLGEIEEGKADELRNLSVALGINLDKLWQRSTPVGGEA